MGIHTDDADSLYYYSTSIYDLTYLWLKKFYLLGGLIAITDEKAKESDYFKKKEYENKLKECEQEYSNLKNRVNKLLTRTFYVNYYLDLGDYNGEKFIVNNSRNYIDVIYNEFGYNRSSCVNLFLDKIVSFSSGINVQKNIAKHIIENNNRKLKVTVLINLNGIDSFVVPCEMSFNDGYKGRIILSGEAKHSYNSHKHTYEMYSERPCELYAEVIDARLEVPENPYVYMIREDNADDMIAQLPPNVISSMIINVEVKTSDGKLKETVYYSQGKEIAKETFDDNGNIIDKAGIIPDGTVSKFYESGKIKAEINYKNNKREGKAKIYYENGKLSGEYNYKNNKLEGPYKAYDKDYFSDYYEEGTYRDGKQEGPFKQYYSDNKKIKMKGNFKNGKIDGTLKEYGRNGSIYYKAVFKDGVKNKEKNYDTSKKIFSKLPNFLCIYFTYNNYINTDHLIGCITFYG